MSVAQYLRRCSLVVSDVNGKGIEFADFRVEFQVRKGDIQSLNSLDARVYNLSRNTEQLMKGLEFVQVKLGAGYLNGNFGLIFQGALNQVRVGRIDQKDTYIDFTASDGDEAYNFATVSSSLVNATSRGIADTLLNAMAAHGVAGDYGYVPNFPPENRLRTRVLYGAARDELRDFAAANNVVWSIQDNQLTFIPKNAYLPGDTVVISPSTGLIGIPEQMANGIAVKILLNPNVKIGQKIQLDSSINQFRYGTDLASQALIAAPTSTRPNKLASDGVYYVMTAQHSGDTRGTPWYTDLVCMAIDATVDLPAANALYSPNISTVQRY